MSGYPQFRQVNLGKARDTEATFPFMGASRMRRLC
jgi:hypothetical protein